MATREEIDRTYTTTLVLVGALVMGQVTFAAVVFYMLRAAEQAAPPVRLTDPLVLAWLLVSAGSIFGAFYFRQLISGARDRPAALQRVREGKVKPANLQTMIVIMWALLEGAGLMGLAVAFVLGGAQILYVTIGYIAATGFVFFPRREWFDAFMQG
ncbi:MAG: hypothetical protein ACRENP_16340 [Longimicrobiales bacterium]